MADLYEQLVKSIDTLSDEQLRELHDIIESKLSRRDNGDDEKTTDKPLKDTPVKRLPCVHCGSMITKKHGTKDGRQRFICKDCGKTFSQSTGSVLHKSRLTEAEWRYLIREVLENKSIKNIANNLGLSPSTVWVNKQKICMALMMEYGNQDGKFTDIAECDEYYVPVSFKGKRDPSFFINVLGRMPRHHWNREEKIQWLVKNGFYDELSKEPLKLEEILDSGDSYLKGISRDQTCILTCKDRSGHLYIDPVCVGRLESADVIKDLSGRFADDAILVTDSHKSYINFAEEEAIQLEQIESEKHAKGPFNLARINSLHSEIAKYWPKQQERIPSTKYMDLSLILFWWLQKNKDKSLDNKVSLIYDMLSKRRADVDTEYDKIKDRELDINTKGYFPRKV